MLSSNVVIIGPSGGGKTSIVSALQGNVFSNQHRMTVGADYYFLNLNQGKVQIWDTDARLDHFQYFERLFNQTSLFCLVIPFDQRFNEDRYLAYLQSTLVKSDQGEEAKAVQLILSKADLDQKCFDPRVVKRFLRLAHDKGYNVLDCVIEVSARNTLGIQELKESIQQRCPVSEQKTHFNTSPRLSDFSDDDLPKASPYHSEPCYRSYSKICLNTAGDNRQKIIALLNDYTKGTTYGLSTLLVLAHGHFRRHHTALVRTLLKDLEKGEIQLNEVLDHLNRLPNKNASGSLARRLDYINQFLTFSNDQDLEPELLL